MKKIMLVCIAFQMGVSAMAQKKEVHIKVYPDQPGAVINKNIYGQFAEHLGTCIYNGLWVGEKSPIANVQGYRKDVLEALQELQIPVLRWPGGCFADEYHWMDGIGPRENRPKMVNNNWGRTVEDNSFGTHEFLNLCEILKCEPYVSGNVGSGSVEELAKWVEYMTAESDTPMANLRRENGREKPWKVKYLGVGNESWGCGGDMRPEYYADLFRRYAVYCRDFGDNKLFKIASGSSGLDYNWTEVLMKNIGKKMNGVSLHYYTINEWSKMGSATNFDTQGYYSILEKCLRMDDILKRHSQIMDRYDEEKKVGLMVDEWGTWFDEEPGTVKGHLYQQNTMRDAFVAALTLNIFHQHADRVQMANIAQVVNVLQSMILTKGDKMLLTPTYFVFKMYRDYQDAQHVPLDIISDSREVSGKKINNISASASLKNGTMQLSLVNIDLDQPRFITIDLGTFKSTKITGTILNSKNVQDYNTFENPTLIASKPYNGAKIKDGKVTLELPAASILVLNIK